MQKTAKFQHLFYTFPIVRSPEIWALSQATFVRSVSFVGYDLSYRVRALEAASATTQRTENPIRTLFVFLDPRAQTGKVSCFLELVAVAIVLPLSVVLPVEARRRPLLGDSEARCSAIA